MAKSAKKRSRVRKTASRTRSGGAKPAAGAHAHSEFELNNDHIEASLRTGEHQGLLEDYFGPDEYAELRQLARDASVKHVRGRGPKVLILPGIMGSKIGKPGPISVFDDVYWFDPVDIGAGRLRELTLPSGSSFEALGVMLIAYLKLKLRLQIGGYDAEFHAFDWRQSLADLGRKFAKALDAAGGKGANIVAHSMGGLVARYALGTGAKCKRLIMLGTPNHGSFAPVQALRATYSVVRNVAAIDLKHSPEDLARDVFSTFPGLTQMLPTPEKFKDVDLYDLANWPDDGLRPRAEILREVKAVQKKLAPGDSGFFLIAGVDQETVTGLRKDTSGFAYELSRAGDGTVPLDFARLPGVPTYHVNEAHGSLPNNKKVAQSVLDILDRSETSVLPTTYDAEERRAESVRPEAAFKTAPYGGRRGALVSQRELREALEDVAAPSSRDEAAVAGAPPPAAVAAPEVIEAGYRHPFDHVVVGRRRQHRIDLRFAFGSITEADTRALAVGVFRDVAPSGAARAIDERLGGAITEVTRRRMFSSDVGEVLMLPTGRHPIAADYVAFVGLGPFDRFTNDVLQVAAENLIRTFVNCQVEEFATVLFGAGSGEEAGAALQNLLSGFIRGLRDADVDHRFRRIVVCETDEDRYTQLKAELYRLSSTALCQEVELTFDEVRMAPPVALPRAAAPPPPRRDPVYLIVRQERTANDGKEFDVRTSVLTAGGKATVVTGVQTINERDLQTLIESLVDPEVHDLSADGERLGKLLLSNEVRAVLPKQRDRHLIVVHDAPSSRIPWETIAVADGNNKKNLWFPAADRGLSHRYAAENLSVAKWLEQRLDDDVLTVLLVVNPTEDLPGADEEGELIEKVFAQMPGSRLDTLRGAAATRPALMSAFGSGKYDLIHYAGHAFFNPAKPEQSGIVCHGEAVLSGADLATVGNLPTLVFFNACESGRLRLRQRLSPKERRAMVRSRVKELPNGVSFAEAFMRGGVANLLATYWPVGDHAAKVFAETFYLRIMKGDTLSEAIQSGRAAVKKTKSKDWADYIFYGEPDFALKTSAAARAAG